MRSQNSQTHLLIYEDDKGRKEFILENPTYLVGKSPECHLRLKSPFVSRRHATLERVNNSDGTYSYKIIDGEPNGKPSANGVMINGRKITTHILQDQDEIVLGPQVKVLYHLVPRDAVVSGAEDPEFDITLISPNMIDEEELFEK